MKKIIYLSTISILLIVFNACNKPDIMSNGSEENIEETRTMDDLEVAADFDWKTTTDVKLKLSGETTGIVYVNAVDGANYHKAVLIAEREYNTKITVPSYVKELVLSYEGQSTNVLIDNNVIEYNFN